MTGRARLHLRHGSPTARQPTGPSSSGGAANAAALVGGTACTTAAGAAVTAVGAGAGAAVIAVGADERDARSGLGLVTSFVRHPAERRGHTAGGGDVGRALSGRRGCERGVHTSVRPISGPLYLALYLLCICKKGRYAVSCCTCICGPQPLYVTSRAVGRGASPSNHLLQRWCNCV